MSCFFFDFGVALGAPWDELTCNPHTPVQSKHIFFEVFSKALWMLPSKTKMVEKIT